MKSRRRKQHSKTTKRAEIEENKGQKKTEIELEELRKRVRDVQGRKRIVIGTLQARANRADTRTGKGESNQGELGDVQPGCEKEKRERRVVEQAMFLQLPSGQGRDINNEMPEEEVAWNQLIEGQSINTRRGERVLTSWSSKRSNEQVEQNEIERKSCNVTGHKRVRDFETDSREPAATTRAQQQQRRRRVSQEAIRDSSSRDSDCVRVCVLVCV